MPKKLTTEEFKQRLATTHPNLELLSEYINSTSYVMVKCKIHNHTFKTKQCWLKAGHNCQKCYDDKRGNTTRKSVEQFIKEAKEIHGDKYDYSLAEYKNNKIPITIICPKHGEFKIKPLKHLQGQGCPQCGDEYIADLKRMPLQEFIRRARERHGDKYNYSKVEYKNCETPIIITCPIHGDFPQRPCDHLNGNGCPKCNSSHLENDTRLLLERNGIEFQEQQKFDWMGAKSLDFYIPSHNIAIECQGGQHFYSVEHYGGKIEFEKRLSNDIMKNHQCNQHGIKVLYVINSKDAKYLNQKQFADIYCNDNIVLSNNINVLMQKILNS